VAVNDALPLGPPDVMPAPT